MKHNQQRPKRTRIKPQDVHRQVVQAYVSNHCKDFSWAHLATGFIRNRDWERLLSLSESVESALTSELSFDESCHTEYGSAASMLAASQFVALVSKYQFNRAEMPSFDPDAKALETFQAAERRNRRLNKIFLAHLRRGTERHWSVGLVREEFCRVLGETPFYERIYDRCDFSGGASVLTSGADTCLPNKLGGKGRISGSIQAFAHFKLALWRNSHYRELYLEARNGFVCYDRDVFDQTLDLLFEEADYNILCVVPKKAKSGRTIAKEPEIQNFVQKGIDEELRELLRIHLGIDISDQSKNQLLALEGSIQETDPYVTLDVKGASWSMLTNALRAVTPPRWFSLLDQTRSHYYRLQGNEENIPYEMLCSMGNGFCFPLETLLFAAIVKAAYRHCGAKADFRCYGDDIICRQSVALVVIEALNAFGFQVNRDKTHIFGPFRESCGANWYCGQDVTPGYYKERVQSRDEIYALHNTLRRYGDVSAVVRSFVQKPHLVPEDVRFAWITNQACIVPGDLALSGPRTYWHRESQSLRYPVLVPVPVTMEPSQYTSGLFQLASRNWDELLVEIAVLRGSTADAPFHKRGHVQYFQEANTFKTVKADKEALAWHKNQAALCLHARAVQGWEAPR